MKPAFPLAAAALALAICACTPEAAPPAQAASEPAPAAAPASNPSPTSAPPMTAKLAASDPTAQLVNLGAAGALDLTREDVRAYVDATFGPGCDRIDGLPFDRVCQHYGADSDDPSPWPDLMLGIRGERIVAAVVTSPAQQLGGWRCDAVPGFDAIRACVAPGVNDADREAWLTQWAAFFKTAD